MQTKKYYMMLIITMQNSRTMQKYIVSYKALQ